MKPKIFILIASISFLIFSSCAIKDIIELSQTESSGNFKMWYYEADVPIYDKTFKISDYYSGTVTFTGSYTAPSVTGVITEWPVPADGKVSDLTGIDLTTGTTIPLSLPSTNFDGIAGDDFTITKIRLPHGKISISLAIKKTSDSSALQSSKNQYGPITLTIDSKTYNFTYSGTPDDDYTQVFVSTDFPDPANDYCIDRPAGDVFTVTGFDVGLKNDTTYSYAFGVDLYITVTVDAGTGPQIIGNFPASVKLASQNLPLSSLDVAAQYISQYRLDMSLDNSFEAGLTLEITDQSTQTISPANIAYSTAASYYYATSSRNSAVSLPFTKGSSDPDLDIYISKSDINGDGNPEDILLSYNGSIRIRFSANVKTNQ